MSEDLIKREDAIEVAYQLRRKPNDEEWDWWLRSFNAIPSADRPQGEWKPFDLTWGRSIWYCTACEESTEVPCDIWEHKPIYKYCPNCGADMRGADDERQTKDGR